MMETQRRKEQFLLGRYLFKSLLFIKSWGLLCFSTLFSFFGCSMAYGVPRPGIRIKPQFQPMLQLYPFNPLCQARMWSLSPGTAETPLILLCHSENSQILDYMLIHELLLMVSIDSQGLEIYGKLVTKFWEKVYGQTSINM